MICGNLHDIYEYMFKMSKFFFFLLCHYSPLHDLKGALLSGNPLGALGGAGKQAGSFFKGFGF